MSREASTSMVAFALALVLIVFPNPERSTVPSRTHRSAAFGQFSNASTGQLSDSPYPPTLVLFQSASPPPGTSGNADNVPLPVDQHMLFSLIAPRPVYVNGGVSDQWSDPKGEFLAMVAAGPVYRLLGATDLGTDELPRLDAPMTSGHLAFHYHSQGHRAVPEDWKTFLRFADRHHAARGQ